MELRGRVVVVTGASAGIGHATAVAFAKRGARVVLAARRLDRLEELATRIERAGGRALAMNVDVTDHEQLERLPGMPGRNARVPSMTPSRLTRTIRSICS
jgi:NADP-dependent 3-hydroxy acid dehydrogenase YdfG